jgi:hypothetical protein
LKPFESNLAIPILERLPLWTVVLRRGFARHHVGVKSFAGKVHRTPERPSEPAIGLVAHHDHHNGDKT